jgi:TetR/AcrR family transcriptional regulator
MSERLHAVGGFVLAPDGAPSIDEVARMAGVPRTTLYYYFAGRDDLVDFLLFDKVERMGTRISSALDAETSSAGRLATLLRTVVETIADHPALCSALIARLAVVPAGHPLALEVAHRVLHPLAQLLREGCDTDEFDVDDPEVSANALYGAVSMAALSRSGRPEGIDAGALAASLLPQLLSSVRFAAER